MTDLEDLSFRLASSISRLVGVRRYRVQVLQYSVTLVLIAHHAIDRVDESICFSTPHGAHSMITWTMHSFPTSILLEARGGVLSNDKSAC